MNKKVIIVGVLGLVGVGAYFYFKDKLRINEIFARQTTLSVPPKGKVLSNPEEVIETAKKKTDAKALANKINILRLEKENIISNPREFFAGKIPFDMLDNKIYLITKTQTKIQDIDNQISDAESLIKNLGFKEVNGDINQIV